MPKCDESPHLLAAVTSRRYTFGTWVDEDMGIRRVGGDATLLPNGDVMLTSGAQSGCMVRTIY
jgi:hypothetical protein